MGRGLRDKKKGIGQRTNNHNKVSQFGKQRNVRREQALPHYKGLMGIVRKIKLAGSGAVAYIAKEKNIVAEPASSIV